MRCFREDHNVARIIKAARQAAHEKHGDNSIEKVPALDPAWLPILVEEVGEVAQVLTYDGDRTTQALVDELVDVLAVTAAWLDALLALGTVRPSVAKRTWLA